jgi:Gpi18-like mannosyltransferase
MLVMLICSVMAAATSYLVQSARFGRGYQAAFIAITLVAPLLLAALVANVRALILRHRRP